LPVTYLCKLRCLGRARGRAVRTDVHRREARAPSTTRQASSKQSPSPRDPEIRPIEQPSLSLLWLEDGALKFLQAPELSDHVTSLVTVPLATPVSHETEREPPF
jgi:hypothetical protein